MSKAICKMVSGTINGFGFASISNGDVSQKEHLARIRKHFETVTISEMTVYTERVEGVLPGMVCNDDGDLVPCEN